MKTEGLCHVIVSDELGLQSNRFNDTREWKTQKEEMK